MGSEKIERWVLKNRTLGSEKIERWVLKIERWVIKNRTLGSEKTRTLVSSENNSLILELVPFFTFFTIIFHVSQY